MQMKKRLLTDRSVLIKIFSYLHHMACHTDTQQSVKYDKAYRRFMKRHCGDSSRQSSRFANKFTAHRWL